ncbi:MAG: hypothetical protein A2351_05780 [Omnitrophica bacterium RIFOXYB12_FULL_50_7]|nr:MAG: hypothetical protein A2351_05780 [Omnitrophica bacterium RIFOXYB12_FULL_50_7]
MEENQKTSKLAISALVFGILSVILKPAPIIAIILAETFRYNNKKRDVPLKGAKIAWWGFGLGLFFLIIRIVEIFIK